MNHDFYVTILSEVMLEILVAKYSKGPTGAEDASSVDYNLVRGVQIFNCYF